MGCHDRESNFGNLHYSDGKWWASWGSEGTIEAPEREVLEERLKLYGGAWAVEMTQAGSFLAKKATIPGVTEGIFYASNCPVSIT